MAIFPALKEGVWWLLCAVVQINPQSFLLFLFSCSAVLSCIRAEQRSQLPGAIQTPHLRKHQLPPVLSLAQLSAQQRT
jgi:hypothetical protein